MLKADLNIVQTLRNDPPKCSSQVCHTLVILWSCDIGAFILDFGLNIFIVLGIKDRFVLFIVDTDTIWTAVDWCGGFFTLIVLNCT